MAVIDVGTNSILYLLAETNTRGEIIPAYQEVRSVRLGRNVATDGIILSESLKEAVRILNHYRNLTLKQKAHRIVVIGTQVFRAATNSERVCETIRKKTGFHVEILTEKEEAEWSYTGAIHGRQLHGLTCVVDIGGGSTEVILGDGEHISALESIKLGAVGLTERYIHHDPPLQSEWTSLEEFISASLKDTVGPLLERGEQLIGVGGTVTALAAQDMHLEHYDPDRVDGSVMPLSHIQKNLQKMKSIPLSERQVLLSLDPNRADIVLAGTAILRAVMGNYNFEQVIVSDRGLRFGIALRESMVFRPC